MAEKLTHIIMKGWGYDTRDGNFARATHNIRVRVAYKEHAKSNHFIVYDGDGNRYHVQKRSLAELLE